MKVTVEVHPYAIQWGSIEVPDSLTESEIENYIDEHFDDIEFGSPDLDYCGTGFEFSIDDE